MLYGDFTETNNAGREVKPCGPRFRLTTISDLATRYCRPSLSASCAIALRL